MVRWLEIYQRALENSKECSIIEWFGGSVTKINVILQLVNRYSAMLLKFLLGVYRLH
jgi:hypothetical protein